MSATMEIFDNSFIITVEGTQLPPLQSGTVEVNCPRAVSRDGRFVAYVQGDIGKWLYIATLEDGNWNEVTAPRTLGMVRSLAWQEQDNGPPDLMVTVVGGFIRMMILTSNGWKLVL